MYDGVSFNLLLSRLTTKLLKKKIVSTEFPGKLDAAAIQNMTEGTLLRTGLVMFL